MNISEQEYKKALQRLEELLPLVNEDTADDDPLQIELIQVSDLIETYEEEHHGIGLPTLRETIALRMFELKLKQKDLAALLGTSSSRISDYLNGRRQITLEVAKALHKKLGIDAEIILQD